ncbi:MAG TPA: FAD-dependent monooxygenase [Steroidobacteraceae bacterium]|nr:FAD-dependent monooxygenase [Steroidobacteraceae bacterium]
MSEKEVPVVIVGGSLVGLSAGLLLARHGVRSLVLERHSGTAIHPRAAHATQRTMEIFRSVDLEAAIRERSAEQFVQDGGVVEVETLVGGATREFIADLNAGIRDVSPCERVFLSQHSLEPLIMERARALGVEVRFSTEAISVEEDSSGVTTLLRDRESGATTTVRSPYLVAADGAHGGVRRRLGIGTQGHSMFSRSITIYFRADLRSLLAGKRWAVVYVNNPRLRGFFRFEKPFDSAFLAVNTEGESSHPVRDVSTGLTPERALDFVACALGSREIPVAIDSIMHWDAAAEVAERLQTKRVFIAGDAAHVMPPTGGFGGNTGIQDAHNLAWKLARVIKQEAPATLLATYDPERRPVARLSVEQAYTRYVLRTDPSLGAEACEPLVNDLNIELGYVYRSRAIAAEAPDDGAVHVSPRESRARPGTRAPHLWLERRGQRLSSLDLYGQRFVLLAGPKAEEWCRCARIASSEERIALDISRPGADGLEDRTGSLSELHLIESDGCLLVRPDGFVAWRARNAQGASVATMRSVLSVANGAAARE